MEGSNRAGVSRKQKVYEVLRDRILSLELESSAAIFENEVASELGVSRTPVREALAALEQEGLVRIVPGKGAFVSPTSSQRIMELYEVREVLEGLAASLAAGRIRAEEFRPMQEVFQGNLAGTITEAPQVVEAADRFHQLIVDRCGNEHLQLMLHQMSNQVQRLRAMKAPRAGRMLESSREHLEIMQAIVSGEAHLAETLMRHHIKGLRKNMGMLLGKGLLRPGDVVAEF